MKHPTGDYILVCRGVSIRAHSWVLAMRSPFFKAALSVPMVEKEAMRMEIKETSPETLVQAVDFMYGKEI